MYKNHNSTLLTFLLISFIKFYCPGHNSKTIQGILLKLHILIKDIERKCSVQKKKQKKHKCTLLAF